MINEYNVGSIEEYHHLIGSFTTHDDVVIFRSNVSNEHALVPEIANRNKASILSAERDILSSVLTYGGNILGVDGGNKWRLMCIAQELGFDTRLLEWTSDAEKALWSVSYSDCVDAIYILKVSSDDLVCFTQCHEKLDKITVFKSMDCNIAEEDSCKWFTCHPIKNNNEVLSLSDELENESVLGVIYLSEECCSEIRRVKPGLIAPKITSSAILMEGIDMDDNATKSVEIEEAKESKLENKDLSTENPMDTLEQYGRKYHADFDFD
ncbi:FRG domain-containing protein [Vibrio nomapromontoriensis]|uniref:FRG domain-containing protein n=1 Tax=Vibrio nomapromontoriensis TaxID=2910246 RepID=UPI003D0D3BEB